MVILSPNQNQTIIRKEQQVEESIQWQGPVQCPEEATLPHQKEAVVTPKVPTRLMNTGPSFSNWKACKPQSCSWTGMRRWADLISKATKSFCDGSRTWKARRAACRSSNWGNSIRFGWAIRLFTWMPWVPSCTTLTSDHCWSLGTAPRLATCNSSP